MRRFYRDGFRNVGLDQILGDVEISKTAFYKHFESKDDLMVAVLESQNGWVEQKFRETVRDRGGATPLGRLRAVFDVVEDLIESDGFRGCIFVSASMEFPLLHEPAHVAALHNKRAIEDIVCELAAEAGIAEPRQLAKELCMIAEGAYVTRQITGDRGTIDIARKLADLAIASHARAPLPSE